MSLTTPVCTVFGYVDSRRRICSDMFPSSKASPMICSLVGRSWLSVGLVNTIVDTR